MTPRLLGKVSQRIPSAAHHMTGSGASRLDTGPLGVLAYLGDRRASHGEKEMKKKKG
jgi:hypothetical protein